MKILRLLLAVFLLIPAGELSAAVREDWARVLLRRGIRPSGEMPLAEWNRVLDNVVEYGETNGLDPTKDMTEETWQRIVAETMEGGPPPVVSMDPVGSPSLRPGVSPAPPPASEGSPAADPFVSEAGPGEREEVPVPESSARPAIRKKVTLDLKNMDVVEVLKILSRQSGLNIVVGQRVKGRVTVFLKDVPFWVALDNIMTSQELAYVLQGDVLNVMSDNEYEKVFGFSFGERRELLPVALEHISAAEAKAYLDPFKSKVGVLHINEVANTLVIEDGPDQILRLRDLAKGFDVPLETRVFKLNYAAVEDLLPKVTPLASKDFGHMQSDKRSNTLVVRDNPARLKEIEEIIRAFDVPHKAVMIDAKIIQVNLSNDFQWGINWERAFQYKRNANSSYSGSVVGNTQVLPLAEVNPTGGGVTAPGFTARIASLGPMELTAAMNFLETVGKTNLLSSPRITALNNEQAKIVVGSQVPKITKTTSNIGSTTQPQITTDNVTFENVGLELFVTPVIGEDGYITMKINPKVTALESTITTAEGSSIPVIRTSEAETTILAKDGVTVLIAGLIEDKVTDVKTGVPLLARIPVLGWIFGSKSQVTQKSELVIFLTPHIVSGSDSAPEAKVYLKKAPQWKAVPDTEAGKNP